MNRAALRKMNPLLAGLLPAAAAALVLFLHRYQCFGDPIVDFGPEAYVAWRVSAGALLYRDLAYLYGPFAPHWNALGLLLLGPTRDALLEWNFATFLAALFALHALLRRHLSPGTSALLTFLAVLLAGFNQVSAGANYNFVAAYRYGLPHAFALSLFSLLFLGGKEKRSLPLSGLFLGLTFLAKPEVFVALAAAHGVAWLEKKKKERLRHAFRLLAGAAAPLALWALYALARGMSLPAALGWPFYPYSLVLNRELRAFSIYHASAEQLGPAHLAAWLVAAAFVAAGLGFAALLARKPRSAREMRARKAALWLLGALVAAAALLWPGVFLPAGGLWRLGPAACLALFAAGRGRLPLPLLAFAFVLSWKVLADSTLALAGFVLALPCALWLLWALLEGVPRLLPRKVDVEPTLWKAAVLLLFAAPAVISAQFATEAQQAAMAVTLTSPTGDFRYYPQQAALLGAAVKHLKENYGDARSFTVLPEGSYVNFLLRKPSPMPFLGLLPDQVLLHGAPAITAQLAAAPAEVILLLPRSTAEFGVGEFRDGYGKDIYAWIEAHYRRDPAARSSRRSPACFRPRPSRSSSSCAAIPISAIPSWISARKPISPGG